MADKIENLKPFKPGQSGNPEGARKHKGLRKKTKELTRQELKELGDLILKGNIKKLEEIAKSAGAQGKKNKSVLMVWVASVALKAITKGDMNSLDTLLNRLIGPVPKDVQISNPDGSMRPQVWVGLPDNGRGDGPPPDAVPDDLGPDEEDGDEDEQG